MSIEPKNNKKRMLNLLQASMQKAPCTYLNSRFNTEPIKNWWKGH